MRRTNRGWLMVLPFLWMASPALAQAPALQKPRIAVLNVVAPDPGLLTSTEMEFLTEDIREQTIKALKQWFDFITPENLDTLLREFGTDISKCSEGECELDVGRNVQAAVVISGRVGQVGHSLVLRISAHRTETGSVIVKDSVEAADIDGLRKGLPATARRILSEIASVVPHGAGPAIAEQALGSRPEAFTPVAAELAMVAFDSNPPGAVLEVDGKLLCQVTPCRKSLTTGTHTIGMRKERYLDKVQVVSLDGSTSRVGWTLDPDFGWVTVNSAPTGLPVKVDGRDVGRTPLERLDLAPGPHDVLVTHPQYYELGKRIVIDRGEERRVELDPTPRQGGVKVTASDANGNATVASVAADGRTLGNAPGQWTLLIGTYEMVVKSEAGVWKGPVTVRENEVTDIDAVTRGAYPGQCIRVDDTRGGTMCFVPAGSFRAGCGSRSGVTCIKGEAEEEVGSTGAFWIDRTEVTVAEYEACMRAGSCSAPAPGEACNQGKGRPDHPINCVGYDQARTYCEWAGKRLPDEDEWEKAARGEDGRLYPWGSQPANCRLASMDQGGKGCGRNSTAPVGSHPAGASPYGVLDLAGNLWEWVGTTHHALRGGSWVDAPGLMRASLRLTEIPTRGFANTGFRCARYE